MKRGISLTVLGLVVSGAVIVTTGGAQVYPVRLDQEQAEPRAPTPPSLVLADGGLQFPDGSVQTTAAQVILIGPALVPLTGLTICYDAVGSVIDCTTGIGPGQDGDLQAGVRWPNPRFADNGNGTVTDNLTGLIWLDDADCFGNQTWPNALVEASALFDGCSDCGGTNNDCGLTDGSLLGAWRLPNVRELQSLVHYGVFDPAVPNTAGTGKWIDGDPFSGVQSQSYWSSTTVAINTANAWSMGMGNGVAANGFDKTNIQRVWPVRGGQ